MPPINYAGAPAPAFSPNIPRKLLRLIDETIEADGGAAYRKHLRATLLKLKDAFRGEDEGPRGYVGASILGNECARAIYYDFHWATRGSFNARMLRLFNRGHLEEAHFIALFLMVGAKVYHEHSLSFKFADNHGGGTGDSVGKDIPHLLDMPYLLEFKTHKDTSFDELAGSDWRNGGPSKGVRAAKPEHYVQMQIYMHGLQLRAAVYCAVNKNTDDLYMEVIEYDAETARYALERADAIIGAKEPPPKLNQSPGFWKCKFCDHNPVCHQDVAPVVSCRTCVHGHPADAGKWWCTRHERTLVDFEACGQYEKPHWYGDVPF